MGNQNDENNYVIPELELSCYFYRQENDMIQSVTRKNLFNLKCLNHFDKHENNRYKSKLKYIYKSTAYHLSTF